MQIKKSSDNPVLRNSEEKVTQLKADFAQFLQENLNINIKPFLDNISNNKSLCCDSQVVTNNLQNNLFNSRCDGKELNPSNETSSLPNQKIQTPKDSEEADENAKLLGRKTFRDSFE